MNIDLPSTDASRLAEHAKAAGFAEVELFVRAHLQALASTPTPNELPTLTPAQLQISLAMCDRGMAEIENGQGRDAQEVLLEIGRKRGYRLNE